MVHERSIRNRKDVTCLYLGLQDLSQSDNLTLVQILSRVPADSYSTGAHLTANGVFPGAKYSYLQLQIFSQSKTFTLANVLSRAPLTQNGLKITNS